MISNHPFYPNYKGPITGGYFYQYKPNSVWANQYPDNYRRYFNKQNMIIYHINSHGFRDYEFKEKNSDRFRIIAIGDSFTFGQGVWIKDTFSKLVEKTLDSMKLNCEVFNLGVNGYGIRDVVDLQVHPSDKHPNEIAHRMISEKIVDFLKQNSFPKNYINP